MEPIATSTALAAAAAMPNERYSSSLTASGGACGVAAGVGKRPAPSPISSAGDLSGNFGGNVGGCDCAACHARWPKVSAEVCHASTSRSVRVPYAGEPRPPWPEATAPGDGHRPEATAVGATRYASAAIRRRVVSRALSSDPVSTSLLASSSGCGGGGGGGGGGVVRRII